MAYIPTIRTFEDDVNDHRGFDEAPITGGIEKINKKSDILVPEKKKSSLTKKVLTFISILLILASLALVAYYFYNDYLEKQENARLILEAEERQKEELSKENIQSDLYRILPKLAPGIAPYTQAIAQKNNIIILTIKDSSQGIDNYSALYAYILAHKKDLNSDLFHAFNIENVTSNTGYFENLFMPNLSTTTNTTEEINIPTLLDPKPMSSEDVVWESKTLNNQDFEVADAGLTAIVYGYANKRYLIMTISINDFLETARTIQTN